MHFQKTFCLECTGSVFKITAIFILYFILFLPPSLRSVKHYFLLDQGDFIVQFMDSCEAELSKNIDDIVPTRLETLLELALRTSAANGDPYKDDMRTELIPYDLMFQMFKILSIETHEEKGECVCVCVW